MQPKLLALIPFLPFVAQAGNVHCVPDAEYFRKADVVFAGTVIERESRLENFREAVYLSAERKLKCGPKVATFEVEEILKGSVIGTTKVFADDGCFGVDPYIDAGKRYIFFGTRQFKAEASYNSLDACATKLYSSQRMVRLQKIAIEHNKNIESDR